MLSDTHDQSSQSSDEDAYDRLSASDMHASHARELHFNFGGFPWKAIEVLENERPAYFCEVSELARHKPDVTLHAHSKGGPVVGACHFKRSRSLTCGIGSDETSMQWIKMQRQGLLLPSASFEFQWAGKRYTMRKAKSADVGGASSGLLQTHFKVVDDASGKMVGLYVSENGLGRRKGTLRIAAGVSEELQLLIILGIMSWRSKISRNSRNTAVAGAGGL